jgi:hypothetical protein
MERKSTGIQFYSPKAIPRKERRIGRKEFGFGVFRKRRSDGGFNLRKGTRLTSGPVMSATQSERPTRQRARAGCWASGRIRPKAGNGARAGATGRGEELGFWAEREEER